MRHRKTPLFRILTPFLGRLAFGYILSWQGPQSHFTKIIQPKKVIKIGQNGGISEPQNAGTVAAQGIWNLEIKVLYI